MDSPGRSLVETLHSLFRGIHDWWNPPCPKHPGHRQREVDGELMTSCAMVGDMCSLCWEEFEAENEKFRSA